MNAAMNVDACDDAREEAHEDCLSAADGQRCEADAWAELAQAGALPTDATQAIAALTARACALLGADYSVAMLRGPDGGWRRLTAHGCAHGPLAPGQNVSEPRLADGAHDAAHTVVVASLAEDSASPIIDRAGHLAEGGRTALQTPLLGREGLLGALALGWRSDHAVGPTDLAMAEALAGHATAIIDNLRLRAERDRALAAAEADRVHLRTLQAAIGTGIITLSAEGVITAANDPAEEILGTRLLGVRFEIEGAARLAMAGEDGAPLAVADRPHVAALRSGEPQRQRTVRITRPDGAHRWLQIDAAPIPGPDGRPAQVVNSFVDVSAHKRAEHALAEQSRILELISTGAPLPEALAQLCLHVERQLPGAVCAMLLLDDSGKRLALHVAPNLPAGFGATVAEGIEIGPMGPPCGRAAHGGAIVIVPDIALDGCPRSYREAALREGLRACWSLPVREGGAARAPVWGTIAVYYATPHTPDAAEQALVAHAGHLAAIAIRGRRAEQALTRVAEGERLRALGEMASGVAHDFNNMLAVILGRCELLGPLVSGERRRSMDAHVDVIKQAAHDGAETVKRLQAFSGISRAAAQGSMDLAAIVRDVIEFTRPRWKDAAQERGITIQVETALEALPAQTGSPAELREVLVNLVFNAIDAMPHGGAMRLRTRRTGGSVIVEVQDSGIGMTDSVRRRVFEPFYTTKGTRGSGLGLSVCYGIVQSLGGQINVESAPGAGTTFSILLPFRPAAMQPRAVQASRGPRLRVLLVDDEQTVLETAAALLRMDGHLVHTATSGGPALELATNARPDAGYDVVLTDLGMPGMNGRQLVAALREAGLRMPCVLVTGWGNELSAADVTASGAQDVLPKPFSLTALRETLARVRRS